MHFKSIYIGKGYLDDDGSKIYIIFRPVFKCLEIFSGFTGKPFEWKSNKLLEENITTPAISDNNFVLGYEINFHSRSLRLIPDVNWGKNAIIFDADNSLSKHTDNRKKDMLILGEGPTQGLSHATIIADSKYSINITRSKKKFCFLSQYYN